MSNTTGERYPNQLERDMDRELTKAQARILVKVVRHIENKPEWRIVQCDTVGTHMLLTLRSHKWWQDQIMLKVGPRGATYRQTVDNNARLKSKRVNLSIELDVYVRSVKSDKQDARDAVAAAVEFVA